MNRKQRLFAAVATCLGMAAFAAEEASDEGPSSDVEEIIVLAHPLAGEGLALPSAVLEADELERKMVDNIGATVGNEPGIHNSSLRRGRRASGHPRHGRQARARHGGTDRHARRLRQQAATTP